MAQPPESCRAGAMLPAVLQACRRLAGWQAYVRTDMHAVSRRAGMRLPNALPAAIMFDAPLQAKVRLLAFNEGSASTDARPALRW